MRDSGESLSVLRERVEQEEQELESAVRALAAVTRRSMTPAHWIRERPLAILTGALVFGWWLGSHGASRSRERNRG
jgi:hypothetical protein